MSSPSSSSIAVTWIFRQVACRRSSTVSFASCSWSRPGSTASATAATTRRRRWGSSPASWWPAGRLDKFEVPIWVILVEPRRDRPRHHVRRLAHRPHDGLEDHQAAALRRLLRRDRRARSTLIGATLAGIPVSTTHTITGAIIGVGATRRVSAVKWGVAGRIVWAWVITIPVSAPGRRGHLLDRRRYLKVA